MLARFETLEVFDLGLADLNTALLANFGDLLLDDAEMRIVEHRVSITFGVNALDVMVIGHLVAG